MLAMRMEKMMNLKTQPTKFEVELTGKWSSDLLRGLADLVDIVEHIPSDKRQEAIDSAFHSLAIDKNKSAIRLVVDNG